MAMSSEVSSALDDDASSLLEVTELLLAGVEARLLADSCPKAEATTETETEVAEESDVAEEEIAREEPVAPPPPEVPKKLGAEIILSIRLNKGTLVKRGSYTVNTFETVFLTRHRKGNSVHAPFGMCRTHGEFTAFRETFRLLNRTGAVIKSEYPQMVPEADDYKLPSAAQTARLEKLSAWTFELLVAFSTLPKNQKKGACEPVFDFFGVADSIRDKPEVLELKAILREKLFDGDFAVPTSEEDGNNARFAKANKGPQKLARRYDRFVEERTKANHFEYRFDQQRGAFYMFNPYSGECILEVGGEGGGVLDRSHSHWKVPDPFPENRPPETSKQDLYPVFFTSRLVKSRTFRSWNGDRQGAALVLTAAARGLIARARMQEYLAQRFQKILDKNTQCFYFADSSGQLATSWTKPRLAGSFLIKEPPLDLRNDVKTVQASYCDGPIFKRRAGKGNFERYKPFSPSKNSQERALTEREPEMPDLEDMPYRVLQLWLDDNVTKFELYRPLKELFQLEDWETLLLIMQKRTNDKLCQMYCCYAFSRMRVGPGNSMFADAKLALEYLLGRLSDWHGKLRHGCNQMLMAGLALLRILETHAGRVEFFNTKQADDDPLANIGMSGDAEAAVEQKLEIFCKLLRQIPVEVFYEQVEKGYARNMTEVAKPTLRGVEMTEIVLQILAALLHERDTRDVVGEKVGIYVVHALRVCNAEAFVLQHGLRVFYNSIFMSVLGWEALVWRTDLRKLLVEISDGPMGGDAEVQRELRRVELATMDEGWAGNVEREIEREMNARRADFVDAFRSKENSPEASPDGSPEGSHGSVVRFSPLPAKKKGTVWSDPSQRPGTVLTPGTLTGSPVTRGGGGTKLPALPQAIKE